MPRRKPKHKAKRRAKAAAAAKKNSAVRGNPNPSSASAPTPQPRTDSSPRVSGGPGNNKRPMIGLEDASEPIRSKKIRRRSSHHSHPHHTHPSRAFSSSCPAVLVPTAPLPLAVYQPASLFAILLVATLLPKNTFSLRWLALSGGIGGGGGLMPGGKNCLVKNGYKLFAKDNKISSSLVAMALDREGCMPCEELVEGVKSGSLENGRFVALWKGVTGALEKTMSTSSMTPMEDSDEGQDWWIDSVLDMIPRGGDDLERDGKTYAGLVNLGNTCYLNAQLQCAYHVPYLRRLILDAEDEIVDVEVEVEVEVEDDEDEEGNEGETEVVEKMAPDCNDPEGTNTEKIDAESDPESLESQGDDDVVPPTKKKTIIKKEMKQEIKTISGALRALQHTFNSLGRGASAGSTNVLCRALGINPYLQQDGQEFWKLFVPEVDYSKLASLYSGFFEDYVREIVPEESEVKELVAEDEEEKKEDYYGEGEQKETVKEARARVRTEPFLDLSIPVAEGTGGSVESTLREMFTQPEILRVSEGNGWRPSKGAEKVDAYKGSSLRREGLPSLLQLHLKRFKYDWETGETSKINDCCSFPLELDLSEISETDGETGGQVEGGAIYDLQSIVIHKGEYGSGHYYSYVRPDIRRSEWLRFDDEFVTPVEYGDVVTDAYGGSRRTRKKRLRSDSFESHDTPVKRRRGLLSRIFSFFRLFRRVPMIGSSTSVGGCGFGYGGRASSAYMLQYARRSDIPKLYSEEHDQ